jgi:hypothetical protein
MKGKGKWGRGRVRARVKGKVKGVGEKVNLNWSRYGTNKWYLLSHKHIYLLSAFLLLV